MRIQPTSSITKDAAQDLGLQTGTRATGFVKSTEVAIGVDWRCFPSARAGYSDTP